MTFDSSRPTESEPFDPTAPATFAPQPVAPTGPRAPLVKPKSSSLALNALLALAAVVAIGGIAFAIGRTTAPAAAADPRGAFPGGFPNGSFAPNASFAPGASGFPGGQGGIGGLGGGITISGKVQSVSADTLTIETKAGQTIELSLDQDTTYHRKADGAAADVTTGSTVEVQIDFAGGVGRPAASADSSGPLGTASSVTVVP